MLVFEIDHKAIKLIPMYACGIYSIHNKLTNDRYIGSSTNLRQRLDVHICSLTHKNNRNTNKQLLHDFCIYGADKFEIEILEFCENNQSTIDFLECKYIRQLGTYNKVRVDGRKVKRFDLQGNFIKEYKNIREAAKDVNISMDNIYLCCKNIKKKSVRNSMWRFSDECPENKIENYKKYCPQGGKVGRKIVQFDKYGKFIRVFNKIYEAVQVLNADHATITRCCKHNKQELIRSAYGYKWQFYEDFMKGEAVWS